MLGNTAALERPRALGYVPALDGLRGVAIALVLWLHLMSVLLAPGSWHLFGAGIGLDIFFVLSGFLITTLLMERTDEGPGRLRRFYARRAARLLPALLAFLAGHAIVALVVGWSLREELVTIAAALTFTSNWVPALGGEVAVAALPLWSLAVEEQFYLLWPAVLVLLARLDPRRARWLIAGAIVVIAAWRAILTVSYGAGYPIVYQRTDARLDALLVGAGLALLLRTGWSPSQRVANRAGALGGLVIGFWLVNPNPVTDALFFGGYTLVALAAAGVILALVRGSGTVAHQALAWPPIVGLGRISYSLYLWHFLVFVLVRDAVPGGPLIHATAAMALSLGCAHLSHRGIEQPVQRWAREAIRDGSRARTSGVLRGVPRPSRRAAAVLALTSATLLGSGMGLASAARVGTAGDRAAAGATPLPGTDRSSVAPKPEGAVGADLGREAAPSSTTEVVADPVAGGEEQVPTTSLPASPARMATRLVVSAPVLPGGVALEVRVELTARLTTEEGVPLAGRSVTLAVVGEPAGTCGATTAGDGTASCTVSVPDLASSSAVTVTASFAGDASALPAVAHWPPP